MANQLQHVAQHFRNNVNWQKFVNLSHNLGRQFNDPQWRFFKAVIFENAIAAFSDGSIKYVALEGCDHHVTIDDHVYTVETKYVEHALFAPRSSHPRHLSQCITLMNSKGTNTHRTLPANYADYLLVIGSRGAAMIDRVQLEQWIDIKGDSITAQIPTHCMDFVFTPQTISGPTNNTEINLRRDITETLFRAIQQMQ